VTHNDRVVQINSRRNSNNVLFIYDRDWNLIESGAWKYEPSHGTGNPNSLVVGSESSTEVKAYQQQQTGWADPRPGTGQSRVVDSETVTTKAGRFDTVRIESSFRSSAAATPLTEGERTYVLWFSPKLDHWVKWDWESRIGGRLVQKTHGELIEYKLITRTVNR
jgi:hypothetical protein